MSNDFEEFFVCDENEFKMIIQNFCISANLKDLFYLTGSDEFLKKGKNSGVIIKIDDEISIKKSYMGIDYDTIIKKCDDGKYVELHLENKPPIEEMKNLCREIECTDRKWLDIIDKTCKEKMNEDFVSLILKQMNITVDSIKRPSSFDELDIKTLINILYDRDLTKPQDNIQSLAKLMYCDNDNIIQTLYLVIKKIIKHFDEKQNEVVTLAAIIGLIIATEKSSKFPRTLTEAYNIFYDEVFNMFSEASGYQVLMNPYYYPIIYFNKMPSKFFKAFPLWEVKEEYDIRIEIQNILIDCVNDDKWILENQFDEETLRLLCMLVLTDYFSKKEYPLKITKQEKFEFAFCLFLLIIKIIPKKTLESAESFWQCNIISIFMLCYISDSEMRYNQSYEIIEKNARNEIIEKLKSTNDLDFIIFIFIIANQIGDKELLDLIKDKDEIKMFAFDKSNKIKDLLLKLENFKLQELLQSIDDYFTYKTNEKADILVSILRKTYNDMEISYNEVLTSAIHDMIDSNIEYETIYNEVKNILTLNAINETEKKKIYELISTGEYILKANNIENYSPSVNQYCSALEVLLNDIIYKPYFYEIQDICLFKNNNRGFTRDNDVKSKYFGDTPHAMWIKDKKLSPMGLGDLKTLMENILNDNDRFAIFTTATNRKFKNIDIKSFLNYICRSIEKIKPDRDNSAHGGLINRDEAEKIRAKVYKNEHKEKLDPTDLILKIDKDLN